MILSDLFGVPVLDAAGQRVGAVTDVRFEQRGGARSMDIVLFGLLVSPKGRISSFGYERRHVRGPAPIAAWERRRHRGAFLVRWDDVAGIERDVVRLRDGYRRYSPVLPED
jgi:sporulation protein YlmC with PRC-barrel domain